MRRKLLTGGGAAAAVFLASTAPAFAQEADPYERFAAGAGDIAQTVVLDNIFIFVAAVLVFFMQAGFALVEAGLTRAKNSANIMMKNLMDACVGVLVFALVGWGIAYPGDVGLGGLFGFAGLGIPGFLDLPDLSLAGTEDFYPLAVSTDFLFQAAFAATAATIVSGAVAERTKFVGYLLYTIVITGLIYPVIVSWQWGGGWLSEQGFVDFAGSGLVHMTGGVAALMGAIALGPRIGKFTKDGKPRAIPGHSIPLAITGVLILFIGWFGFNPGSQLAADMAVPVLAVITLFAAMAGGVAAMATSWATMKKPDVSMAGNGVLAGLVAVCSGVGSFGMIPALVTGGVAGVLVVFSVLGIERVLKVDDPVGASSVHAVCGFWGLVATGLMATDDGLLAGGGADLLVTQVIGGLAIAAFVAVAAGALFFGLKAAGLLRVSAEDEILGLDLSEHGAPGYGPELLTASTSTGSASELAMS
jgi:Amt family ammonium transporter